MFPEKCRNFVREIGIRLKAESGCRSEFLSTMKGLTHYTQ
jgi:hypothetical protein